MRIVMLTTKDNPYDPFTQFEEWFLFDVHHGYNSCAYLDRIAKTSDALSDEENDKIIEDAIDEIVKFDPFDIYEKRVKEIEDPDDEE